jgi:ParB-like chromosome segregation protein Spo0J
MLDEVLTRLELRLEDLDQEVIQAQNVSTIPFKQHRLILKTQKRKLSERRDKMADHQQLSAVGDPP